MVGSGMSSSTPSCSQQLLRLRSWLIVGAGNTTRSGRTRLSRGVRPWGQLNRELQHDQTPCTFIRPGPRKGGTSLKLGCDVRGLNCTDLSLSDGLNGLRGAVLYLRYGVNDFSGGLLIRSSIAQLELF